MLALALALALVSGAEPTSEPGVSVKHAPGEPAAKVTLLPSGNYEFNRFAFQLLDSEMKRLQSVEREHKAEQWWPIVLVSSLLGFVACAIPAGLYFFSLGSH